MKKTPNVVYTALREIAKDITNIPVNQLSEIARDPKGLTLIISIAYNAGIQKGRQQSHRGYNRMFKDYSEQIIKS